MLRKILLLVFCFYITASHAQPWIILGDQHSFTNGNFSNPNIYAVHSDGNGNVYAAGDFTNANGETYVAHWNGTAWSELGTGTNGLHGNSSITVLEMDSQGNIYVGGYFTNANNEYYIAKWNGTSWNELGAGTNALHANGYIWSLAIDAHDHLYAGGYFMNAANEYYVAHWDGTSWTELGGSNGIHANTYVMAIAVDDDNNVYASKGQDSNHKLTLSKWDGTSWTQLGIGAAHPLPANGLIRSIQVLGSEIYFSGNFTDYSTTPSGYYYLAKWDGTDWSNFGGNFSTNGPGIGITICPDEEGNIFATGTNLSADPPYYNLAKWNGSTWSRMDEGYSTGVMVWKLFNDTTNTLYAAGVLGQPGNYWTVARFDDTPVVTASQSAKDNSAWSIYPNPTSGQLKVNAPETGQLKVYDASGILVYDAPITSGTSSLAFDNMREGLYTVLFYTEDKKYPAMKLIKN